MPRAIVVETDTTELTVALQRGCRPATAEVVTFTVTRTGSTCNEVPPLSDSQCYCVAPIVMDPQPSKVYRAVRIERDLAVFVVDQDLIEAPEGWYLGRVDVDGCEMALLTIFVTCTRKLARASGPLLGCC